MKRSEVNQIIREAENFFRRCSFRLPPFACRAPSEWDFPGRDRGIFDCRLGRDVMIGAVSAVNDDSRDNLYYEEQKRFPEIEEDEAPYRLLVSDYDAWFSRNGKN